MYAIKENKEKRKKIKLFWENQNLYPGSAVEGMKRLNGIIGMGDPEDADTYFKGDEHMYGLGQTSSFHSTESIRIQRRLRTTYARLLANR